MKVVEARYFQGLYEVAAAMNSVHTASEVLRTIVKSITQAMEVKACSLLLLSPNRKSLRHAAVYGLSRKYIGKGSISADKSISETLLGKTVFINDVNTDEQIQYREQAKKEGIVSILAVPVILKNKVIGTMRIYSGEPRTFSEADSYMLRAAANLGAIALENARLYEKIKMDYKTLHKEILEWNTTRGYEWIPEEAVQGLLQQSDE